MSDFSARVHNTVDYQKIQKFVREAKAKVLVGFPAGRMHIETQHDLTNKGIRRTSSVQGSVENAELAKKLYFGSAEIPARPFLRDGLLVEKESITKAIKKEATKALAGSEVNWNKIGAMAVGAVQGLVRSDFYKRSVPNSKETIQRKGSDTPLIDGGDLMGSLTFVVDK